ncbi:MAG: aminotransferase class I/II-fold pyridoxal phosphate-dependent enzyme [Solirubrobacteraceae bacterium]
MTDLKQYRIKAASAAELVNGIEAGVASGALVPGQRLPSVRRLAAEVGLSPVTVAAGLAELRRRGVVLSEPRRGTRIGQGPPIGSSRAPLPVPPGARDLSRGNPDPALLPDLAGALARCELPARLYGEPQALPELLELAREQLRADGVPGQHLCIVSGAMDAIERVLEAHVRPGDRVAVENPGYAALYDLLRAKGLALEPVALDERGMLAADLRRALSRGAVAVVLTPRGQNPTGAALDSARARELSAVLGEFPRTLLIEDDHLGPVAGSELHTLLSARSHPERWAATRSVAKALGPDLRLAVLAGDAHTIARVQGRQQCGPGWVSHILQSLVLALWSDPAVHELVARASATYSERRERLLSCLASAGVQAHGASGLNVWIPAQEEAGTVGALMQRGWVVAPGAAYRLPGAPPGIRVTTATLTGEEAARLAGDLADVLAPALVSRSG